MTEYTISLNIEIPEPLYESLAEFIEGRTDWDQDRVMAAALSMFLLQNRSPVQGSDRKTAKVHLDSVFGRPAA